MSQPEPAAKTFYIVCINISEAGDGAVWCATTRHHLEHQGYANCRCLQCLGHPGPVLQCCMLLLLSEISTTTCLATAVVGKCRIMHSSFGQCACSVCSIRLSEVCNTTRSSDSNLQPSTISVSNLSVSNPVCLQPPSNCDIFGKVEEHF